MFLINSKLVFASVLVIGFAAVYLPFAFAEKGYAMPTLPEDCRAVSFVIKTGWELTTNHLNVCTGANCCDEAVGYANSLENCRSQVIEGQQGYITLMSLIENAKVYRSGICESNRVAQPVNPTPASSVNNVAAGGISSTSSGVISTSSASTISTGSLSVPTSTVSTLPNGIVTTIMQTGSSIVSMLPSQFMSSPNSVVSATGTTETIPTQRPTNTPPPNASANGASSDNSVSLVYCWLVAVAVAASIV